jgi:hypothetical protein
LKISIVTLSGPGIFPFFMENKAAFSYGFVTSSYKERLIFSVNMIGNFPTTSRISWIGHPGGVEKILLKTFTPSFALSSKEATTFPCSSLISHIVSWFL